MKLVSINIVNWNGLHFLSDCIESTILQTYKNIEINIIDNNSSDGSVDLIKMKYPEIRLIKNTQNEGFSKAHNQAIKVSSGDYILPLNFDIVLSPQFVEEMVKAIEISPEIGIVSGILYTFAKDSGKKIIDSAGINIKGFFPADRGQGNVDCGQYDKLEYVFGASGAAPLFRREMLKDIAVEEEYFDEDYYIYVEDVDLCWRAQLFGWKAVYTPRAIAYHKRGATREKSSTMKRAYITIGHRNRYWSIIKNAIPSNLIKNVVWILMVEFRFYIGHLLQGNYFIIQTIPMVIRSLHIMLRKRKEIQKRRKADTDYMERFFFGNIGPRMFKDFINTFLRRA